MAVPGCLGDTGGIAPPDDELIYPVALATIQDDSYLLIVNSNSYLEYNAGTLVAYQLSAMETFNGVSLEYDDTRGVFTLPPGVPFSSYCSAGTTRSWCSLNASPGIRKEETIRLGAYASDLNITPRRDKALIPVRGERAIMVVDVAGKNGLLDCGDAKDDDRRCDDAHTITSDGNQSFPIEPHHVETMDYTYMSGTEESVHTLGFATHRAGGEVSLFHVADNNNRLIDVIDGVIEGASGIAVNPRSMDILVTGQRQSDRVAVLNVETNLHGGGSYLENPYFGQDRTIYINGEVTDGTGGAGDIVVSPDGKTGFVVIDNPSTLLVTDLDRYEITDMVPICQDSSRIGTFTDDGDPNDPLDDKLYAYVLCYYTSQVYIIDPEFNFTVIRKTGPGPQDITFDEKRQIAYISNFADSTISMIQAVPPFNVIEIKEADGLAEPLMLRIGDPQLAEGY